MSRNYTKTNLIMRSSVSLLALTMISGLVLISNKASADSSAVSTASITVPIACTMRGEGVDSHTATLAPNTYSGASGSGYENGIGKTTLTAICNDDNGFSIYAIGYTGNQYEGENHTKLIGQSTSSTIATKAYASGDTTSNWSMKLTKITDSAESYNPQNLTIQSDTEGSFDTWHSVPDTYTKVAEYHANTGSSTTDTTLGVKLETTYAAYISSSQPADTYVGQVKYTMVHPYTEEPLQPQPSASGKICYYANASSAEGTMGCQNVASSVTLLASNFSRTGYGFAGWSDKFDYATNDEAKFYGPQETMTIPDTSIYTGEGKGLSLYAVWVKSAGNLQDTTKVAELCGTGANALTTAPTDGTANLESVSALTDQRDNNTYAIAKLADGKCWMIENLRLENTGTDNTNGSLAQGYNSSFIGLADPETPWSNNSTAANSLYTTESDIQGKNTISGSNQGYRFPRYNNTNTSARAEYESGQNVTTQNASIYSYGNYYTWPAAIADTTAYTSNNTSVTNTSICPSGWHLPIGGSSANATNSDFWQLGLGIMGAAPSNNSQYTSSETNAAGKTATAAFRSYPNNFVYSGNVYSGSVTYRGSYGSFWSSTATSSGNAYYLNLYSSYVYPGAVSDSKYYGRTVRCVAPGV